MGKQTKETGSTFGGQWTKEKLAIIGDYLSLILSLNSTIIGIKRICRDDIMVIIEKAIEAFPLPIYLIG